MKDIKIYIASHKKVILPSVDGYIPLQVGAALHDDLGYLKDNSGDNISKKNPNYCELTGLYYIWKNEKADIVGLTHYRRYFFKNIFFTKLDDIINKKEIDKILNKYDIILPKKLFFKKSINEQYKNVHNTDDLEKCGKIIKKKHPEYISSYNKVMKRRYLYGYNMFIMNKSKFDNYMEWLFDILIELESKIDISKYDDYNKRIYGFLSERLFNVWIEKNNLKIKEIPVYNVEESKNKQIVLKITNYIKKIFKFI